MIGCTGTPTPGIMVTFPTSGDSTPTYDDDANGYSVTAAEGNVVFIANGLAADHVVPAYNVNPGESLTIGFFESDMGVLTDPRTATNIEIFFIRLSNVEIEFTATDADFATLGPVSSTMGSGNVDIGALFGDVPLHSVTMSPINPAGAQVTIPSMQYDHDCL